MTTCNCTASIKFKSVIGTIHVVYRQIVTFTYIFRYIKNVQDQPLRKAFSGYIYIN